MRREQGHEVGFTLLEMLVTMALFSLLLSFFGALFNNLRAVNAAIIRIERSENVNVVSRYLQQSLEGIRAYSDLDAAGTRTVRFRGEQSRVEYVGVAAGDRESGGLYETEVWLDSEGRFLLHRRMLGQEREQTLPAEVLLEGLDSLTFSYFTCPVEDPSIGLNRWTDVSQLPFLISVTATFKAGDQREWHEIFAFVRSSSCAHG